MPLLLLLLLAGFLAYRWLARRGSTLTRLCRWRQVAPGEWGCVACGAALRSEASPRQCLNPAIPSMKVRP